jgi:mRNA interferase RelE/StbE
VSALRIPPALVALVRGLHPQLERKIRAGLDAIVERPAVGKALRDELLGLRSHRVGKFRIIYRQTAAGAIEIVAIGPRRNIYAETFRLIKKGD